MFLYQKEYNSKQKKAHQDIALCYKQDSRVPVLDANIPVLHAQEMDCRNFCTWRSRRHRNSQNMVWSPSTLHNRHPPGTVSYYTTQSPWRVLGESNLDLPPPVWDLYSYVSLTESRLHKILYTDWNPTMVYILRLLDKAECCKAGYGWMVPNENIFYPLPAGQDCRTF